VWQLEAMLPVLLSYSSQLIEKNRNEIKTNSSKRNSEEALEEFEEISKKIHLNNDKAVIKIGDARETTAEAYGTITKDIPKRVLGHTLFDGKKPGLCDLKKLFFKVEWSVRLDSFQPEPSFYSYSILKREYPSLLLNYIENVIQLE
jgi:hypothetical protein